MATDGVKIIDGDRAHDTYWSIMNLYDSGVELEKIEQEVPLINPDYFDDFDNEIYVTSCGLAYWEIGLMTGDRLLYIKSIIDKGVCVKEWDEEYDNAGQARQKVLDRYWRKISQPNNKIRNRKKYRKVTNFHFQQDDLLTFKLSDGNYRAVICSSIDQYRGNCDYILIPTTYNSSKKPTVEDLLDKEIVGRKIGSGYDRDTTQQHQPGIERIWAFEGVNHTFFFGLDKIGVSHKNFFNFKDKFECVGTLRIVEGLKETGSLGGESDFEGFERVFKDLDSHIKIFQAQKYPVRVLCEV
jgi:hypothetical protein